MLGLESAQIEECIQEVLRRPLDGVFASRSWGFHDKNLDVLARLPALKHIWLWDIELDDVAGLYALSEPQYLGLHGKRPAIDFSRFPSVHTISVDWHRRDRGLPDLAHVRRFYLWHHKPRDKSVVHLELPDCSEEAQFNWTNAHSLQGLNGLRGVRRLEVHRGRNLASLDGAEILADTLEEVIVTTCGKLTDTVVLAELPHLRLAIINGKQLRG